MLLSGAENCPFYGQPPVKRVVFLQENVAIPPETMGNHIEIILPVNQLVKRARNDSCILAH